MTFGEKLFKLRKEKGISQETLAVQLKTTRQAVSKWENNQGYPETEKLLQISNIFGVSVDFLLKQERLLKNTDNTGYYVSKEMARGFLTNVKKTNKYIGLFFMFSALAGIPFVTFQRLEFWRFLGITSCFVLGIISAILGLFSEDEDYKVLKKEPLLFDQVFMNELQMEYLALKKKYKFIVIPCTIIFILCFLSIFITVKMYLEWTAFHSVLFLGLAIGLNGFVQSMGIMDAYDLLVKNEQHCERFFFKLKKKITVKL